MQRADGNEVVTIADAPIASEASGTFAGELVALSSVAHGIRVTPMTA